MLEFTWGVVVFLFGILLILGGFGVSAKVGIPGVFYSSGVVGGILAIIGALDMVGVI